VSFRPNGAANKARSAAVTKACCKCCGSSTLSAERHFASEAVMLKHCLRRRRSFASGAAIGTASEGASALTLAGVVPQLADTSASPEDCDECAAGVVVYTVADVGQESTWTTRITP
jgi:hypothetical protein